MASNLASSTRKLKDGEGNIFFSPLTWRVGGLGGGGKAVGTPGETLVVDGGADLGTAPPRSSKSESENKGQKYKQVREQDKRPQC